MNSSPVSCCSLASQTHLRKRGKDLVSCVYKSCPTALYSAVQSRCTILSHDTLHHCLSSTSNLENSERELGHLRYCRNCKNTSTVLLREHAFSTTSNSREHYFKSGYIIKLIAFRWDTACIHSSPDASLSGFGLWDYTSTCVPILLEGFLIIQLLIVLMYTITVWKPQTLWRVNNYTQLELGYLQTILQ